MESAKQKEIMLQTSPAQLIDQAAEVSSRIDEVARALDELEAVILRTSHYWIGEAGDYYRILYGENKEEIQEMMRELRAHPAELLEMAHLTAKAGPEDEMSHPLPADVL